MPNMKSLTNLYLLKRPLLYFFLITFIISSCGSYRQNIMFKKGENSTFSEIDLARQEAESNYTIKENDFLSLQVFTKNGERLIDPDYELSDNIRTNEQNSRPQLSYLVRQNGFVKLPMIGDVKLAGMSIVEAEEVLQKKYETYYKEPFLKLKYLNKRVVVLGALGGQVIPLASEKMRITEILALSEGIDNNAKVQNIRLLRGDQAFLIDLSTIEGYKKSNMVVRSGDIIYVEPVRRPFTEFIRENGPVISVLSSVASLIAVLISIR